MCLMQENEQVFTADACCAFSVRNYMGFTDNDFLFTTGKQEAQHVVH
jgi:hypothetical protein